MPNDDIEIKQTYVGKHLVFYKCPVCQEKLKSALRNAGNYETCPACKRQICVPGESALEQNWSELDLPRHRQLDASRLKHDAKLDVIEHKLLTKDSVRQNLAGAANKKLRRNLDLDFAEQMVDLRCMRDDNKAQSLIQLNDILLEKLSEVENLKWPDELKMKVVKSLYEISEAAKEQIMGTA